MINFIKQFILHPKEVGAVTPSGPELIKLMMEPIDFAKTSHIVEVGPGDGAITKALLKKMSPESKLTAIEINKEFCNELKKINDSRLTVINGDAFEISSIVTEAEYVVSGLPLVSFSEKKVDSFLTQAKTIAKQSYIQYNYSPLREAQYKKHFKQVSRKIAIKNIPPAIVYTCRD